MTEKTDCSEGLIHYRLAKRGFRLRKYLDGNFERDGIGMGASGSKVGVGYRKELFSGTRMYYGHYYSRALGKKEGNIIMVVFGLLFILISALVMLYGNVQL